MPSHLSWIRTLYIIVLAFPSYSENFFVTDPDLEEEPDCTVYADQLYFCTRESDPICATNGQTYSNACIFCSEKIKSGNTFGFDYFGIC